MNEKATLILGAGIAGLGASYALREAGRTSIVLEKDKTYGGLCGGFIIDGFHFDRFVHFSFTENKRVNAIFRLSSPEIIAHKPNPYNLYRGKWIKHPAQNNTYPLDAWEKDLIIRDFMKRPVEIPAVQNYEHWLRIQYGDYFAEHFPMVYTRKYWMTEARFLRTEWIGNRLYQPSIEEVLDGSKNPETPATYYAKEMRYPEKGGYKQFLCELARDADIRYNERVIMIDTNKKEATTASGALYTYDSVFSSLPLKEYSDLIPDLPPEIRQACERLKCTSGYHISIGLKTKNIPPYLWWYVYDEDILAARVYAPSLKSPHNAPADCSSLQMEVYCTEFQYSDVELYSRTVQKLIDLDLIQKDDIIFVHQEFEKYANVIFNATIYEDREQVKAYLKKNGITPIGRFGEWDYLWSDQSLLSGLGVVE